MPDFKNYPIQFIILLILTGNALHGIAQSPAELYKMSLDQSARGNYTEALFDINKALMIDSTQADFMVQKAWVNFYLGRYNESVKNCYAVQRVDPDNAQILLLRGQICLITNSFGGAIAFFGKAIKLTRQKDILKNAYFNRGKAYICIGKYAEANTDLITAFGYSPDSVEIILPLAETFYRLNQTEEAFTLVDKLIAQNPEYEEAYDLQGRIALEAKDYPKAINSFSTCSKLEPKNATAMNQLANAYMLNNDIDNALLTTDKAINLYPDEPLNFKTRGLIYFKKGQEDEGCNNLFRAFQLGYLEKYGYDLLDLYLSECEKE